MIGDGAYSEEDNLNYCEENHIKNVSKLSNMVTHGNKKIYQKGNKHNNNSECEIYFFEVEKCKYCPFKEGCYKEGAKSKSYSVTIKKDIHIKQMDYMKTEEFSTLYSERYKIEAKNAELKKTIWVR